MREFTFVVSPLHRRFPQSIAIPYLQTERPSNLFTRKQIAKCCGRKRLDVNTTPVVLTELDSISAVRSRTAGGPQRRQPVP